MQRDRHTQQHIGAELVELALYGLQFGIVLAAAGAASKLFGIW